MRDEKIDDWIKNAKKEMNEAFDDLLEDKSKSKVKITLTRNPQQTVEVEPDTEMEFKADAR